MVRQFVIIFVVSFASLTDVGATTTETPMAIEEIDRLLEELGAVDDDLSLINTDLTSNEDFSPSSSSVNSRKSPVMIDFDEVTREDGALGKRARIDMGLKSVRTIVLEEMIKNVLISEEDIIPRIWAELPVDQWVDLKEIREMRFQTAKPLVQTEGFHNMLKSFSGIRSLFNPMFLDHMRTTMGPKYSKLVESPEFRRSVSVWNIYCLAPLEIFEHWKDRLPSVNLQRMPCERRESIVKGKKQAAVVITRPGVVDYLRDELTRELAYLNRQAAIKSRK